MANVAEACLVPGIDVVGVASLAECLAHLRGSRDPRHLTMRRCTRSQLGAPGWILVAGEGVDLSDVRGQATARWCVEVAAAGGHHLFLEGPAGAGKTMLAERMAGLLPDLDFAGRSR